MQPGEFQTFPTRTTIQVMEPDAEKIHIEDIAKSLSRQCRFNGFIETELYSVAQHSVIVSQAVALDPFVDVFGDERKRQACLAGLLHDAAEAYLHDWLGPFKALPQLQFLRELESMWMGAVEKRFGLPMGECNGKAVKAADVAVFIAEDRDIRNLPAYHPRRKSIAEIIPVHADLAERMFLELFKALT